MAVSGQLNLAQIRLASQQRANLEKSNFITPSEWNFMINQSLKELFDLLVSKYGNDYYSQAVSFVTDGQTFLYPLPDGQTNFITNGTPAMPFLKLLGVDLALSNTLDSFVTIRSFSFQDRNRYAVPNYQSFYGVTNLRYRLNNNALWLTPVPVANQTIQLWYIPRSIELYVDSDISDGYGGWLEYVIVDAAIKAQVKQELDATQLGMQKAALVQRIEWSAENRDAGNPAIVTDAQCADMWQTGGNGSGSSGGF